MHPTSKCLPFLLVLFSPLSASLSQGSLLPYRNEYFVETGAHYGAGLLVALQSGFRYLRSVETDPDYLQAAQELLKRYRNVKIWHGNSSVLLWEMIQDIEKPITFFLDAHRFPPLDDGQKNCPLLDELEQIKRHPIKTHTILIDDMSCCSQLAFDYLTKEELIAKLLEINPNYQISYIAGGWENEVPDNILVATPPSHRRR